MKIITQWEESDIEVGNFYYYNPDNSDVNDNISFFLSRLYKIGYCNEFGSHSNDPRYVSIAMSDGWVSGGMTKEEFANELTERNDVPCTGEALKRLLEYVYSSYGRTN